MLKPEHFIPQVILEEENNEPVFKKATITVSCGFGHSATLDSKALFADDRGGRKGLGCWVGWVCQQCVKEKNVPREENAWTGKYDPAGWREIRIDNK